MNKQTINKTLVGLTASVILALGSVGIANAAEPIDPDATGSITVHKFEKPDGTTPVGTGVELDASVTEDWTPLEGATFTVQPVVGLDISTNTIQQTVAGVVSDFDPTDPVASLAPYTVGASIEITTNAAGIAEFTDLPVAMYLVTETEAPEGASAALPFLVTIPLANVATGVWDYNVHVYPKNIISSLTKEAVDGDVKAVGDEISWNITASIPNGVLDLYRITDQLDSKLTYVSGSATLDGSELSVADYTLTHAAGLVTFNLTPAGFAKAEEVKEGNSAAVLVLNIVTEVNETGVIENEVTFYPNESSVATGGVKTPEGKSETRFGGISISKIDEDGNPLDGAIFEVRASHTNVFSTATKVTIDSVDSWEAEDGAVTIDGLRYSNFANGATITTASPYYNFYWLVETTAPEGYQLLAESVPFTVNSAAASQSIEVINVINNTDGGILGNLPVTGLQATLIIAGFVLLVGGLGFYGISRSRKDTIKLS